MQKYIVEVYTGEFMVCFEVTLEMTYGDIEQVISAMYPQFNTDQMLIRKA